MKFGGLPGGPPHRPKSSSVRIVAGHVLSQIRRPGRIRSRVLLLFIGLFGVVFISYGRRHANELQFTSSTLTSYIPTSITDAIATHGEGEDTRWDEVGSKNDSGHIVIKKPKFHLLISSNKPTASLCKMLLSAAILNYPPPTLISYEESPDRARPGMNVVKNTFSFLLGKEVHDDDLVLVMNEDTAFQLPAEVTVSRFLHEQKDASNKLLDKYGRVIVSNGSTAPKDQRPQKYVQRILFGSTKECSNAPEDPACYSIPPSPLPKGIHGPDTSHYGEAKHNYPRYMESSMVIGRAADLRPIYKRASELLEIGDIGKKGSQYIFSQLFGEQEYARTLSLASAKASRPAWRNWFSSQSSFSTPADQSIPPPNITLDANQNHEFGIGLDYLSSVFQVMKKSEEDVEVVRFDQQVVSVAPSRSQAASYIIKHAIHLPPDLESARPPFAAQDNVSAADLGPAMASPADLQRKYASWSSVPLLTNTLIPSASIPATFNFHGADGFGNDKWNTMWYHNSSRALFGQQISRPVEPIAIDGGEHWFDVRGGKGGVWTERGEWVVWDAVCSGFEEELFDDGLGPFATGRHGQGESHVEKGEGEGEGLVKGLWGKIVGTNEGEEKDESTGKAKDESTGNGDTIGGFSQGGGVAGLHPNGSEHGKNGSHRIVDASSEGGKYQQEGNDKEESNDISEKNKEDEKSDREDKGDKKKDGDEGKQYGKTDNVGNPKSRLESNRSTEAGSWARKLIDGHSLGDGSGGNLKDRQT